MTDLQSKLEAALKPLTDCQTADEVADVLRKAGAKGKLRSPCDCPIACYLKSKLGIAESVKVQPSMVTVSPRDGFAMKDLSEATRSFIYRFDGHSGGDSRYPDLVEGAAK